MKKAKNIQIAPAAEETDHDLVVNVLATLYDTGAKYSNPPINYEKTIESHAVRSPTPSSSSDSSIEDRTTQRKKRPISQTLTEEEKLEEERKEKRREKDRIRKRIQREKQRKEKQMQLQAKNQPVLTNATPTPEPVVIPSLQSFFSAYLVSPHAEGDSYGILFPLPKPPQLNVDNLRRPEQPTTLPVVDNRLNRLPQFTPFFVTNNRVMS